MSHRIASHLCRAASCLRDQTHVAIPCRGWKTARSLYARMYMPVHGLDGPEHTTRGFRASSRAAPGLSFRAFLSCPRRSQAAAGWGAPRGQPGQSDGVSAMLLVLIASCSLASPPASIDFESPRISLLPTRRTVSSPSLCLSRCCASAFCAAHSASSTQAAAAKSGSLRCLRASRCGPQNPVPARSLPVDGPRFRAQAGFKVQGPPRLEAVETRLLGCLDSHAAKSLQVQSSSRSSNACKPRRLRHCAACLAPCFNSSRPCLVPVRLLNLLVRQRLVLPVVSALALYRASAVAVSACSGYR